MPSKAPEVVSSVHQPVTAMCYLRLACSGASKACLCLPQRTRQPRCARRLLGLLALLGRALLLRRVHILNILCCCGRVLLSGPCMQWRSAREPIDCEAAPASEDMTVLLPAPFLGFLLCLARKVLLQVIHRLCILCCSN